MPLRPLARCHPAAQESGYIFHVLESGALFERRNFHSSGPFAAMHNAKKMEFEEEMFWTLNYIWITLEPMAMGMGIATQRKKFCLHKLCYVTHGQCNDGDCDQRTDRDLHANQLTSRPGDLSRLLVSLEQNTQQST